MNPSLLKALEDRHLVSVMNLTKWKELCAAVSTLPFPPAFQRKNVRCDIPHPEPFEEDAWYYCDWNEGLLSPEEIEWIRVRPRRVVKCGRLIPSKTEDITELFLSALAKHSISLERDGEAIIIYGHVRNTNRILNENGA